MFIQNLYHKKLKELIFQEMAATSQFLKSRIIALHVHSGKSGREISHFGFSHAMVARV